MDRVKTLNQKSILPQRSRDANEGLYIRQRQIIRIIPNLNTRMQFSRIVFFSFLMSSLASFRLTAQQITISGYVRTDDEENLIGANIFDAQKHQGTITNAYGFYSFTLVRDSTYLTILTWDINQSRCD